MAEASLQDRLRGHSQAFDSLLSLIPAKMYYGEDTSDQWQKKKQSKEEAAAARRLKLDPDSDLNRNAKQVMDERAKNKRKIREMERDDDNDDSGEDDYEPVTGIESEKPGEGLRKAAENANKKQKTEEADAEAQPLSDKQQAKLLKQEEKRASKKERKAEKKLASKAAKSNTPATPAKDKTSKDDEETVVSKQKDPSKTTKKSKKRGAGDATTATNTGATTLKEMTPSRQSGDGDMITSLDVSGIAQQDEDGAWESVSESAPQSPTFDTTEASAANTNSGEPASATTSTSSTVPPSEKPKHIKIPADTSALRARLAAKIEALRAARKADGPDGKPIRTRQELIESRRQKQEQRKEHKKELRKQAKLEEQKKREEALASNSPGVMSPAVELDESTGNFSFGRVAFGDGSQMSHDLSYMLSQGKKKGPSDPKTALIKVQRQKKRLEELDQEQREDIAGKESWLNARRRAQGERIRDDEAALKKSIKRKDAAKKKSEKAWKERASGVALAQKQRQKKREENIQARKDNKLMGKSGKKKKGGAKKKKGGRPGFEGSLGVGGRKK